MNTELIKDNLNINTNKIVEEEDLEQSFYEDGSSNKEDYESFSHETGSLKEDDSESITSEILEIDIQLDFESFDHQDFNQKDDLHNGHIYLIKNKVNNKCYIGQASCFQGSNNNRWGTWGRWLSHLREALNSNQDHCVILNNAIRKYGKDSFEVFTLKKCSMEEINEHEKHFVDKFKSMQPNGYNIREAGSKGRFSEETIEKMKKSHLGTRRRKYNRKYPEDNDLPKYIKAHRNDGCFMAYVVNKFPIGTKKTEWFKDTYFSLSKFNSKEECLDAAVKFLDELKEKYKHINDEVFKEKSEEKIPISKTETRENKFNNKLPENIFAIIENEKINGYFVDGIINHDGISFPKKEFSGKTNRYNLNDAKKYLEQLLHIKNNKIIVYDINNIEVSGKNNKSKNEKYYLPMFVSCIYEQDTLKGFIINGVQSSYYKTGKYRKVFADSKYSTDELYQQCIQHLEEIKVNPELMKPQRNKKS